MGEIEEKGKASGGEDVREWTNEERVVERVVSVQGAGQRENL